MHDYLRKYLDSWRGSIEKLIAFVSHFCTRSTFATKELFLALIVHFSSQLDMTNDNEHNTISEYSTPESFRVD